MRDAQAHRACSMCGMEGKTSACSACEHEFYCSRACQKMHYKTHKAECAEIKAAANGRLNPIEALMTTHWRLMATNKDCTTDADVDRLLNTVMETMAPPPMPSLS